MGELVDAAFPAWGMEAATQRASMESPGAAGEAAAQAAGTILLAEDSDFYRGLVRRYLEEGGYAVFDAPDGEAAWELLLEHLGEIETVLTDVEMPRLGGLGLTERIRADARTAALPIIALTSLASEEDMSKGRAAGVDDYQVKLDRDQLLESIRTLTGQRHTTAEVTSDLSKGV